MITVEERIGAKCVKLSGAACEVTLFYCFWQSHLWPDWMNHVKLGESTDAATKQHKSVIENIKDGREILLHHESSQFVSACQWSIDRCRLLGVEVMSK